MKCVSPIRKQKWIIEHIEIKSFFNSCKTFRWECYSIIYSLWATLYKYCRYLSLFTHTNFILSCFSRHWRMQWKVVSMQSRLSEHKWKLYMCLWRWVHFRSRFCYVLRYLFSFIQRGPVIHIKCLTHWADHLGWAVRVILLIFHLLSKKNTKTGFGRLHKDG